MFGCTIHYQKGYGERMRKIRRLVGESLESKTRFKAALTLISLFWYLALFPGRLGSDYSQAIRMMHKGESTDWWTASFWWFLKLSTFNGRTIAVSSLISLIILGFALFYLCESLYMEKFSNRAALLVLFCSPIYGGFGLNVSHDVFSAAGIILFTAYHIRIARNYKLVGGLDYLPLILAGVLVITTQYGIFLVFVNTLLILYKRNIEIAILLPVVSVATMLISSFGVTSAPTYGPVLVIVGDIKCVAQHPQAEITQIEWDLLDSLAPRREWTNPTSCSLIDDSLRALPSLKLNDVELTPSLVKSYLSIAAHNPAIVAMAHFQRASVALPPPFFAGPQNQVTNDPSLPIGLGTNTALQSHPGVLHPSIDEPSVAFKVPVLSVLEFPAQGTIFIVNQASWFWGWGGLWLWPFIIYLLIYIKKPNKVSISPILSSTLLLHVLLLILGAPMPRYVMGTILVGNYFSLIIIANLYNRYIRP